MCGAARGCCEAGDRPGNRAPATLFAHGAAIWTPTCASERQDNREDFSIGFDSVGVARDPLVFGPPDRTQADGACSTGSRGQQPIRYVSDRYFLPAHATRIDTILQGQHKSNPVRKSQGRLRQEY